MSQDDALTCVKVHKWCSCDLIQERLGDRSGIAVTLHHSEGPLAAVRWNEYVLWYICRMGTTHSKIETCNAM